MFYLYGKKIGKIGYYCQFSIGDAFVLNSSRLLYRHKKNAPENRRQFSNAKVWLICDSRNHQFWGIASHNYGIRCHNCILIA